MLRVLGGKVGEHLCTSVLNLSTYFPHFLRRGVEQIWLPFLVASWGKDLPSVLKLKILSSSWLCLIMIPDSFYKKRDHHHFFWLHEELRIPYRCKATVRLVLLCVSSPQTSRFPPIFAIFDPPCFPIFSMSLLMAPRLVWGRLATGKELIILPVYSDIWRSIWSSSQLPPNINKMCHLGNGEFAASDLGARAFIKLRFFLSDGIIRLFIFRRCTGEMNFNLEWEFSLPLLHWVVHSVVC